MTNVDKTKLKGKNHSFPPGSEHGQFKLEENTNYEKILKFADDELAKKIKEYNTFEQFCFIVLFNLLLP